MRGAWDEPGAREEMLEVLTEMLKCGLNCAAAPTALFSAVCSLAVALRCQNVLCSHCWATLQPNSAVLKPLRVSSTAGKHHRVFLITYCLSAFVLLSHKPDRKDREMGWYSSVSELILENTSFRRLAVSVTFVFWKYFLAISLNCNFHVFPRFPL